MFIQSAHFAEELATGFRERLPEQLGLVPRSAAFFLGIAGVANGVVRPSLYQTPFFNGPAVSLAVRLGFEQHATLAAVRSGRR